MSSEDGYSHIEVPKPYKEQKSPYKDENAEEPEVKKGILHHAADPLGQGLNTVLKPVGAPLGIVTGTLGEALGGVTKPALGPVLGSKDEKMEALGGDNKDSYIHGKDTIGGHLQTGDNPLGLNQTGSDKFRD
ncbi:uncharacterized protein PV09_00113 [Verruconis gallopava]|uniref:Uncharacterized protein n=1 Tax=Verruconis gallopava TaxID=253628 RepID=A0A0D1Z882_9PEZI|nr:uncharacterized protein PV09_00113 [Verruconis gallopava]KIW09182.1 hypothetical protein PV09_00113 [Verruconis gallopava]